MSVSFRADDRSIIAHFSFGSDQMPQNWEKVVWNFWVFPLWKSSEVVSWQTSKAERLRNFQCSKSRYALNGTVICEKAFTSPGAKRKDIVR
jgi:hypothetical protein